VAWRPQK